MGKSDVLTCNVMDNPAYFADTINNGLFNGVEVVKPENLKELDSTESAVFNDAFKNIIAMKKDRDIIKHAKLLRDDKVIYVIIGIENQTEINYAMPVRNYVYDALRYAKQVEGISNSYRKDAKEKKKTLLNGAEFLSGISKDDKIEPVITLTVYYGTKEWDGPLSLHDMFSVDIGEEIRSLVPNYSINLLEPKKIIDWNRFKTDVGILFEMISASDKERGIEALLTDNPDRYSSVSNDIVRAINFYTKADILVSETEEETDMCYAWETSKAVARDEGREEGREEGESNIIDLYTWLKSEGRDDDAEAIMKKENESLRAQLYEEFHTTVKQ